MLLMDKIRHHSSILFFLFSLFLPGVYGSTTDLKKIVKYTRRRKEGQEKKESG
jgi:hypothetical protein